MKIDLEVTPVELLWLAEKIVQIDYCNFEINKIYRNEDGNINIELKEIILGENDDD